MALSDLFSGARARKRERPLTAEAAQQLDADGRGLPATDPGPERLIEETMLWIGRAQDESPTRDGGVARHYSLLTGWGSSYPETTGYIIPTVIDYADRTGDAKSLERARRMLDWLVSIQFDNGAFQGGMVDQTPLRPVSFNTGQILMGLAAGERRFGAYRDPMKRAADWLAQGLDEDGCWRLYPSPFAEFSENSYDTHVAWGLLEAARVTQDSKHSDAALANIRWAITRQSENGWFAGCCLSYPDKPLTHTLGYALRGVIEGYLFSKDERLLAAARKCADGMMGALRPDGLLAGRLDSNWRAAASWVCVTGSSQIAHCLLLLDRITGESGYGDAGRSINGWVRRSVKLDGNPGARGAVRGSFPIDGGYCRYEYPNWAAKFTIDANAVEMGWNQPQSDVASGAILAR
jgi:hypothetical protein